MVRGTKLLAGCFAALALVLMAVPAFSQETAAVAKELVGEIAMVDSALSSVMVRVPVEGTQESANVSVQVTDATAITKDGTAATLDQLQVGNQATVSYTEGAEGTKTADAIVAISVAE